MYMIAEVSQYVAVASFAEAWIENLSYYVGHKPVAASPPSRRRGLKKNSWTDAQYLIMSPPSRRRGLKNNGRVYIFLHHRRLLRGGVD